MGGNKIKSQFKLSYISFFFAIAITIVGASTIQAEAYRPGKTYNKANIDEIADLLVNPPLTRWVKEDGWILKTGELEGEWKYDAAYMEKTSKNEGKYAIDDATGLLVSKSTGKRPDYVTGFPFPVIEESDPKAGQKVMENFTYGKYRMGGIQSVVDLRWIGENGVERSVVAAGNYLYYPNRRSGPIPNPSDYLQQQMIYVAFPFQLKGMVQMTWTFDSTKEDSAWAYIPMLRRVRRTSAAVRSDPFLGSDFCTDDTLGFAGKTASFDWKFIKKTEVLIPYATTKTIYVKPNADGSVGVDVKAIQPTFGYETPGFKGVPWAGMSFVWVKRPVWVVEGTPKDPYYAYGPQTFYVDADTFHCYIKVVNDKSGAYWKTIVVVYANQRVSDEFRHFGDATVYMAVDDKSHHATNSVMIVHEGRPNIFYLPVDKLGPTIFTESFLRQLSK